MFDYNETQAEIAVTALNKMMRSSFFDICVVDSVAKMLNVHPRSETYKLLRPLHCVHFSEMPASLKAKLPAMIADCLGDPPAFQFNQPRTVIQQTALVVVPVVSGSEPEATPNKPGLFKRLQLAFKG